MSFVHLRYFAQPRNIGVCRRYPSPIASPPAVDRHPTQFPSRLGQLPNAPPAPGLNSMETNAQYVDRRLRSTRPVPPDIVSLLTEPSEARSNHIRDELDGRYDIQCDCGRRLHSRRAPPRGWTLALYPLRADEPVPGKTCSLCEREPAPAEKPRRTRPARRIRPARLTRIGLLLRSPIYRGGAGGTSQGGATRGEGGDRYASQRATLRHLWEDAGFQRIVRPLAELEIWRRARAAAYDRWVDVDGVSIRASTLLWLPDDPLPLDAKAWFLAAEWSSTTFEPELWVIAMVQVERMSRRIRLHWHDAYGGDHSVELHVNHAALTHSTGPYVALIAGSIDGDGRWNPRRAVVDAVVSSSQPMVVDSSNERRVVVEVLDTDEFRRVRVYKPVFRDGADHPDFVVNDVAYLEVMGMRMREYRTRVGERLAALAQSPIYAALAPIVWHPNNQPIDELRDRFREVVLNRGSPTHGAIDAT